MSAHEHACPECGAQPGAPCSPLPENAKPATWSHLGRNQVRTPPCTCTEAGLNWNWPEHQPGCPKVMSAYRIVCKQRGERPLYLRFATFDGTTPVAAWTEGEHEASRLSKSLATKTLDNVTIPPGWGKGAIEMIKNEQPKCTASCKHYRVGFVLTERYEEGQPRPTPVKHPPACEHPSRPSGGLDVVRGEEREDCPLRPPSPDEKAIYDLCMVPAELLTPAPGTKVHQCTCSGVVLPGVSQPCAGCVANGRRLV